MASKPTILLTGASRGLGLAILRLLLSGATSSTSSIPASRVVTISRTLTPELSDLQKTHSSDLVCVQGDVTDPSVNSDAVSKAVSQFGGLDGVILNAGVVETQRISSLTPEAFSQTLNINTVSLVTTISAALPDLRKSSGRVVFVSSGAATGNIAGWCAYNASKAALNAICRTLANEEPVACWAVRPGVVDTDMQSLLRSKGAESMKEEEIERFLTMHKEGKLLKAEQPGWTIAALATRGSREEPRGKDGKGLGEVGAFVTWDEDVLEGYKQ